MEEIKDFMTFFCHVQGMDMTEGEMLFQSECGEPVNLFKESRVFFEKETGNIIIYG